LAIWVRQGASAEKITFVLLEAFRLKLQQLGYVEGKNSPKAQGDKLRHAGSRVR
jgi:hypothetical protein